MVNMHSNLNVITYKPMSMKHPYPVITPLTFDRGINLDRVKTRTVINNVLLLNRLCHRTPASKFDGADMMTCSLTTLNYL